MALPSAHPPKYAQSTIVPQSGPRAVGGGGAMYCGGPWNSPASLAFRVQDLGLTAYNPEAHLGVSNPKPYTRHRG